MHVIDCVKRLVLRKEFMSRKPGPDRARILINHWRWLEANGYKQQAASYKLDSYSIKDYIGYYENKRSI